MFANKEKSYVVCVHTTPSDKKYVGITSVNPKRRWRNGKGYSANFHFSNAIVKYGWDNITHEILFENLSYEEAKTKEIDLIKEYNTICRKHGYNIIDGNNDASQMHIKFSGMYGKKHSNESKLKMSNARKGLCVGKDHHNAKKNN